MNYYRFPAPFEKAIIDYRLKFGQFPQIMVINQLRFDDALVAARKVNQETIKIEKNGGVLCGEVWFDMPEGPAPVVIIQPALF